LFALITEAGKLFRLVTV